jgi:hypothetical protein
VKTAARALTQEAIDTLAAVMSDQKRRRPREFPRRLRSWIAGTAGPHKPSTSTSDVIWPD